MTIDQQEQALAQSWDANAEAWTRAIREARVESRRLATDAAIVAAVLATQPRSVLDVGCGEGWLVREFVQHGIAALGIDGSAPLIRRARQSGGEFRVLSYDRLIAAPRALNRTFDTIVCSFSLLGEVIAPLLHALHTAHAPGGHLVIQTVHPFTACGDEPYRDGWRAETFAAFGDEFRQPMPWFFRTLGSWMRVLHESGWQMIGCAEPLHPSAGHPLSLVLTCRPADAAQRGSL